MPQKAYVLINCSTFGQGSILAELLKLEGVKQAHLVSGPFDIIAYVEAPKMDALMGLIVGKIQTINGVTRTTTCIAIR